MGGLTGAGVTGVAGAMVGETGRGPGTTVVGAGPPVSLVIRIVSYMDAEEKNGGAGAHRGSGGGGGGRVAREAQILLNCSAF